MLPNIYGWTTQIAIFWAIGIVGSVITIYGLVRKFQLNRSLQKHGVLTKAVVIRRRQHRGKYLHQEIDYEYEVNGQRYETRKHHVYADTYARLKEGDEIEVMYVAHNPAQSRLSRKYDFEGYEWGCIYVMFFMFWIFLGVCGSMFPQH